jgi:flagellin
MAIEGILFGSLTRTGVSRVSAAAASAATIASPQLDDGGPVSLRKDAFSVAAGNRLAGRIASLLQGQENANTALSLIDIADQGLAEIDVKLARMKVLAAAAASVKLESTDPTPPSTSRVERALMNTEFDNLRSEIDAIAENTSFKGLKILNGSGGSGALDLSFNVGGDPGADDIVTVSIESGKAANLDSGLATADLFAVDGATTALASVNAAIDKEQDARADLRGSIERLHGAVAVAGEQAAVSEVEKNDHLATRAVLDISRQGSVQAAREGGATSVRFEAQLLQDVLGALERLAPPAPVVPLSVESSDSASQTDKPERASTTSSAPAYSPAASGSTSSRGAALDVTA